MGGFALTTHAAREGSKSTKRKLESTRVDFFEGRMKGGWWSGRIGGATSDSAGFRVSVRGPGKLNSVPAVWGLQDAVSQRHGVKCKCLQNWAFKAGVMSATGRFVKWKFCIGWRSSRTRDSPSTTCLPMP